MLYVACSVLHVACASSVLHVACSVLRSFAAYACCMLCVACSCCMLRVVCCKLHALCCMLCLQVLPDMVLRRVLHNLTLSQGKKMRLPESKPHIEEFIEGPLAAIISTSTAIMSHESELVFESPAQGSPISMHGGLRGRSASHPYTSAHHRRPNGRSALALASAACIHPIPSHPIPSVRLRLTFQSTGWIAAAGIGRCMSTRASTTSLRAAWPWAHGQSLSRSTMASWSARQTAG